MPISQIGQPEFLEIDETLRLRRFDGKYSFALEWYQDSELVWLVDGVRAAYDRDKLSRMYRYLDQHGELYFIELLVKGDFVPVGDVCLWPEDLPITISRPYWKQGIGKRTVIRLIQRARELGWIQMKVNMIYHYNTASRALFESVGFRIYESNEKGNRFYLDL